MFGQATLYEFEELYNLTFQDVTKYVVCHCHNIDDINDIIQNVYFDVLKNLNKKSIKDIKPYVMKIAKNKVKDFYRFSYRNKSFVLKEDNTLLDNYPDDIDIEESIRLKYDANLVWEYLRNKSITVFKVFYLYFHLGFSIKEIAIELNLNESTVKNYLYRTIKEIRKLGEKDD